ncbi:AMP-binding protein [Streptomyces europaeiscabiei]
MAGLPAAPAADDIPLAAPAPWLDLPDVVDEVADLRRRFDQPDLCVASVLCDEHPREDTAFILVDSELDVRRLTFGELVDESRRLAAALRARGIGPGDRVGVLMSRRRELPVVLLALWRLGAVQVPLFTAFAAPAISVRVRGGGREAGRDRAGSACEGRRAGDGRDRGGRRAGRPCRGAPPGRGQRGRWPGRSVHRAVHLGNHGCPERRGSAGAGHRRVRRLHALRLSPPRQ